MSNSSSPVQLILGPQDLLSSIECDLVLSDVSEYVAVYDKIAAAVHGDEKLVVAVSDQTAAGWLRTMAAKYGESRIDIRTISYADRLADLWQVEIPDWVEEKDVCDSNLLEFDIHAVPGQDFDTIVLSAFFSPFLTSPHFPPQRLEDMIRSFDKEQWEESSSKPILSRVLQNRLTLWEKMAENEAERIMIHWLEESPATLIEKAAQLRILSHYPANIGEKIFGEDFAVLAAHASYVANIPSNESDAKPFIDLIRVHLEELAGDPSTASMDDLLETVSGCLEVEFDYVLKCLKSGNIDVNPDLIRRVRDKFSPMRDRPQIDQDLSDLDLLVNKQPPSPPRPDWSLDDWLQWAVEEYFPYRFWMEETGRYSEELEAFIDLYSEWLYEEYPSLRLNSTRMVYYRLVEARSDIASADAVLIVVIDNFNLKYFSDLASNMNQQGFFIEKSDYCLSLLPSCTEVSKKSLLVGEARPFDSGDYRTTVEDTWQEATGKRVRYLPNIGALRKVRERDADLFFLNYLPIDYALHLDENDIGVSHSQLVRSCLRSLTKDIHAFAQRIGTEDDLKVIIVSDHGSTKIPAMAPNPLDQDVFKNLAQDKHHRYISIDDGKLAEVPEDARYQCFIFPKDDFGLQSNYLVAKRLFRFIRASSSTYFHGGLTPEETIVPFAVFSPVSVSPKELVVDLSEKEFYVMRRESLNIQIRNTNKYPVTDINIIVSGSRIDGQPSGEIEAIAAFSQADLEIPLRFNARKSGPQKVFMRISFSFLGQPQPPQECEFDVYLKTIVETKPSIFDLEGAE